MTELYDLIGRSYTDWRQPDPRIAHGIRAELEDMHSRTILPDQPNCRTYKGKPEP